MRRGCHHLTREQQAAALAAATADPERPWADIARELGSSRWSVFRYLRRQLGRRQGTDAWKAGKAIAQPHRPVTLATPVHLACPGCLAPLPPLPDGAGYRCPCGRLITASHPQDGAA